MATTSETPCSRCPGNCLPNTCLPLRNLLPVALALSHTVLQSCVGPGAGGPGTPRSEGLRGVKKKEENKLSPQVILSLPTFPLQL
jgi:hypothetical protein